MKEENNVINKLISKGARLVKSPFSKKEREEIDRKAQHVIQIKANISLEDILAKLKDLDRDNILYTRARWEFLRRNREFQKDFIDWHREGGRFRYLNNREIDKYTDKILNYWKLAGPQRLILQMSFEEHVLESFDEFVCNPVREGVEEYDDCDSFGQVVSAEEAYVRACQFVSSLICYDLKKMVSVNSPITCFPYDVDYDYDSDGDCLNQHYSLSNKLKTTGLLDVTIDLSCSKNQIMLHIEKMIDTLQPHISLEEKSKKTVRKKQRYDLYPLYIQAYDMKNKNRKTTYKEIARKVLENDADIDIDNATKKIKDYYKEARRLIEAASDF